MSDILKVFTIEEFCSKLLNKDETEIAVISGKNGSGKTRLLNLISKIDVEEILVGSICPIQMKLTFRYDRESEVSYEDQMFEKYKEMLEYSARIYDILVIDIFETGLHLSVQERLVKEVFDYFKGRCHLVVTTHSPVGFYNKNHNHYYIKDFKELSLRGKKDE